MTFVARGAHLEAIRVKGLTVRSHRVGDFTVPTRATADPAEGGSADLVLFRAHRLIGSSAPEHAAGPTGAC